MSHVRVVDGKVVEFIAPVPGFAIHQCFTEEILATLKPAVEGCEIGEDYPVPAEEPAQVIIPPETPTQGETNVSAPTDGTS